MSIKNAIISTTHLGYEDHGCFTCFLNLRFEGSSQSFGGYELNHPNYGIKFLKAILDTVGVTNWEELTGKMIRIEQTDHKIKAIGHIMDDKWFNPQEDLL